jgi:thiol-disulfide isomerase/thioredoxin
MTPGNARPAPGAKTRSRLLALLFLATLGVVLFRVAGTYIEERRAGGGPALIEWVVLEGAPRESAARAKPILYEFTAEWCPPCRRLDAEGWADREIARLVNDSFLPARVLDREREEGKNPPAVEKLERQYAVRAFPTLLVAAADGREIARYEGYGGPARLRAFLEESRRKATSGSASASR